MAEEKKDGIKFKLKFDPTAVKAKPAAVRASSGASVNAQVSAPELRFPGELPAAAPSNAVPPEPEFIPVVKKKAPVIAAAPPKEEIDLSSETIPHIGKPKKTRAEKAYRKHLIKSWIFMLLLPVIVLVAAALLFSIYATVMIIDHPPRGTVLHNAVKEFRAKPFTFSGFGELCRRTMRDFSSSAPEVKKEDSEPVSYTKHSNEVYYDSRPATGGRNNPYNVSGHRERINNITSQPGRSSGGRRRK